jgi:hypothetical protein
METGRCADAIVAATENPKGRVRNQLRKFAEFGGNWWEYAVATERTSQAYFGVTT